MEILRWEVSESLNFWQNHGNHGWKSRKKGIGIAGSCRPSHSSALGRFASAKTDSAGRLEADAAEAAGAAGAAVGLVASRSWMMERREAVASSIWPSSNHGRISRRMRGLKKQMIWCWEWRCKKPDRMLFEKPIIPHEQGLLLGGQTASGRTAWATSGHWRSDGSSNDKLVPRNHEFTSPSECPQDPWCCYIWWHGSHQYTPFMLAYIPAPWIRHGMCKSKSPTSSHLLWLSCLISRLSPKINIDQARLPSGFPQLDTSI